MIAGIVERVSHKEDSRFGFTLATLDWHHPDRGGVSEGFSAHSYFMMGNDRLLLGRRGLVCRSSRLTRSRARRSSRRGGRLGRGRRLLGGRLSTSLTFFLSERQKGQAKKDGCNHGGNL